MKKIFAYISVTAIATTLFLSLTGFFGDKKTPDRKDNDLWVEIDKKDADQLRIPMPSFSPIVRRVEGAVLVVYNMQKPPERQQFEDPFNDPFFRFFRPQVPNPKQAPQRKREGKPEKVGSGSGFIIHPDGYALTNNHVIENATKIKIRVGSSQKEYDAEVIGAEPAYDVALIKIKSDRKDWPVIPLGDSSVVQVGDSTLAIGNPFGLDLTVTHGILSARYRYDAEASAELAQQGILRLYDFMQIDAPINPGNSGGPLLNMAGEAIGINTAIIARGNGIGFTIPINQVKQILPSLKKSGSAPRSFLGVDIGVLDEAVANSLGLPETTGALVQRVEPDSPAAKAGIQPGDVITEFAGEPVRDRTALMLKASLAVAGKQVSIKVIRNKKMQTLNITPATRPGEKLTKKGEEGQNEKAFTLESLGFSAVTNTAKKRDSENVEGALVVEVEQNSPAAFAGISRNDVIMKVNGVAITTAKQLTELIGKLPKDSVIQILALTSKGQAYFTTLMKP